MHVGFQLAEEGQYGRIQRCAKMGGGYTTPNKNLKTTYSVRTMIFKVLCDLDFSRNQQLKSADDQHIRIKKQKQTDDFLKEIKKKPITLDIALYSQYCE